MQIPLSTILLLATTALGQTTCPASSIFRLNSVLTNTTNLNATTSSFGYVSPSWWYSARYHAILDPTDSWTLTKAYITDIYNHTTSRLEFPERDYVHTMGFSLDPLSAETPAAFVEINGEGEPDPEIQGGSQGAYYDDAAKIQYVGPDGEKVHWHGCPNRDLDGQSNVTQLGYRLRNATVPKGCYDIELVVEYMDGWNTPTGLPPKCWDHV